jgi:flagellar basal-body rod protein FlgC
MNLLPASDISASALQAEHLRLELVAQNIANAQTTKDVNGQPYQRRIVSFATEMERGGGQGVKIASIKADPTPGEAIYDPQHPHADAQGMVHMPNVSTSHEMVDLIAATRAYEANLAVVRNARQMASQALSIGR